MNVSEEWAEQTVTLAPDESLWTPLGVRHDRGDMYGIKPLDDVLSDVDINIMLVLFPLDVAPMGATSSGNNTSMMLMSTSERTSSSGLIPYMSPLSWRTPSGVHRDSSGASVTVCSAHSSETFNGDPVSNQPLVIPSTLLACDNHLGMRSNDDVDDKRNL